MVFCFSPKVLSHTFLILRKIEWDIIINVNRSLCQAPFIFSDCNGNGIFSTIFQKYSNIKLHAILSHGCPAVPRRRTDSQADMIQLTGGLCNFATAPFPSTPWKQMGEYTFSSIHSQTCHQMEARDLLHASATLVAGTKPGTHWIGRLAYPRATLDVLEDRHISCL